MPDSVDVVVVGAGQAGLSTSHELTRRGVEHVVLERGRVGESWRRRWDSFCRVVRGSRPRTGRGRPAVATRRRVALDTSDGSVQAKAVVVANGAYQRPNRPAAAAELPSDLAQLDADDYRHPGSVPSGAVLIIGSGQTGCQIAEELHEAGRDVVMSCGRAPWIPRRLGGHDIVWWALETGFLDQPVDALPTPAARLAANLQNSGHGGGHDLHFRTLRTLGITLVGRFVGAERRRASFADDLAASVGWATTGTASS